MGFLWCNENLISVACKIRQERNCRIIFCDDSSLVLLLSSEDFLEQNFSRVSQISLAHSRFRFDRLEDEVVCIDLTVRMWVGNADGFTFIFKNQNMRNIWTLSKLSILFLPHLQKRSNVVQFQLTKS